MAGSKPDWNAGLTPEHKYLKSEILSLDRNAGLLPKPRPLDGPAGVNVDNPYLDAAYLRALDRKRDPLGNFADHFLGRWETPRLRPCPFCASLDVRVDRTDTVHCTQCGADGPSATTSEAAVNLWNTRTKEKV